MKLTLAAATLLVSVAVPAVAGEVRPYTPRAMPATVPYTIPVYNWTGLYAGLNTGYSWGITNVDYMSGGLLLSSHTHHNGGLVLGAQAGYNFQWGNFVAGIEGDATLRSGSANSRFTFPNSDVADQHSHQGWLATIRPRAGFAWQNFLFYGTAGGAIGGVEHSFTESRPTVVGASRKISEDETRVGWAAGAGVEAGFSQWSLGLEYLYVDLGKSTLAAPAQTIVGVPLPGASTSFDDHSHLVRAKVNYRWGGSPVTAGW